MSIKKYFILLAMLMLGISVYSQALTGGFILTNEDRKEGYYFWNNGEFIWFRFTSYEKDYGEGRFVYNGDVAKLKFGRARRKFDVKDTQEFPTTTGKAFVQVKATTSGGIPVKGVRSILQKSNIVATTDSTGYSRIEIARSLPADEIRFEIEGYEGHGTVDVSLNLLGKTNLFEVIIDDKIKYTEDQNVSLDLTRGKKSIIIGRDGEREEYRSISKTKFLDYYHRIKE